MRAYTLYLHSNYLISTPASLYIYRTWFYLAITVSISSTTAVTSTYKHTEKFCYQDLSRNIFLSNTQTLKHKLQRETSQHRPTAIKRINLLLTHFPFVFQVQKINQDPSGTLRADNERGIKPYRAVLLLLLLTPNTAMRRLWMVQQPRLVLWLCGRQC